MSSTSHTTTTSSTSSTLSCQDWCSTYSGYRGHVFNEGECTVVDDGKHSSCYSNDLADSRYCDVSYRNCCEGITEIECECLDYMPVLGGMGCVDLCEIRGHPVDWCDANRCECDETRTLEESYCDSVVCDSYFTLGDGFNIGEDDCTAETEICCCGLMPTSTSTSSTLLSTTSHSTTSSSLVSSTSHSTTSSSIVPTTSHSTTSSSMVTSTSHSTTSHSTTSSSLVSSTSHSTTSSSTSSSSSSSSTLFNCEMQGGDCTYADVACGLVEYNNGECWVRDCCEGEIDPDCDNCLDYCRDYCHDLGQAQATPRDMYVETCEEGPVVPVCVCSDTNYESVCDEKCDPGAENLGWDLCNEPGDEGNLCCMAIIPTTTSSSVTSTSTVSTTSHSTTSHSTTSSSSVSTTSYSTTTISCTPEYCRQLYPDVTIILQGPTGPMVVHVEINAYCRECNPWEVELPGFTAGWDPETMTCTNEEIITNCCCGNCLVNLNEWPYSTTTSSTATSTSSSSTLVEEGL
ncbi:MAG: hypothetical protein ABIH11_02125 [Candidatus Altiarchaeota archaeon]